MVRGREQAVLSRKGKGWKMEEKGRAEKLLDTIEKLILDGNKEVIEQVGKKIDETKIELRQEIKGVGSSLRQELGGKIDAVHLSLKNEIRVTGYALKDEIKDRITEHVRLAHV